MPSGERATVAGLDIGGMVYVGEQLKRADGQGPENALINPRLAVARQLPPLHQASMPYWPSYSGISPEARRVYLEWLATGRSEPSVEMGFVFLYFYGLERRLFVENADTDLIVEEVKRLRSIYSRNGSFDTYSRNLLDAAGMLQGEPATPVPSYDMASGFEIPFGVRRYIGARLAAKEPLTARDALSWTLSTPDTRLRTPAIRCFSEFQELWNARFAARYPSGLRISTPRTRLKPVYRAASGSFVTPIDIGSLPDIAAVTAPLVQLRELAYACTEDLAAYSRLLGRKPAAAGTAEAAALLPPEILDGHAGKALKDVRRGIAAYVDIGNLRPISTAELCSLIGLDCGTADRLPVDTERQMSAVLDRLGVGFEPDRRHGPSGPARAGSVVLFKVTEGGTVEADRAQYAAARTMVEVAALAAVADGEVADGEVVAIERDLENLPGLSLAEVARLRARVRALLSDPPKQQATLNRLAKLPSEERDRIAQSAMAAILADGRVMPQEIKFLERLHKSLGLPVEDIHVLIHRETGARDEPAIIAVETRSAGVAIPPEPQPVSAAVARARPAEQVAAAPAGVTIDAQRLAQVRKDTQLVGEILGAIFVDDQPEAVSHAAPPSAPRANGHFEGLNEAHGALLAALVDAQSMDRDAFAGLATKLRLMIDGAIETINDWAYDRFDDYAIEDGDDVFVQASLRAGIEGLRRELA